MDDLAPNELRFMLHGPDVHSDRVSATVFVEKLGALVRALKAADKAVNGASIHEYSIARLKSSTPTVILSEDLKTDGNVGSHLRSGFVAFDECVEAIQTGDRQEALRYGTCARQVLRLAKGARTKFGYAEVWTNPQRAIRVDPLLVEAASSIVEASWLPAEHQELPKKWFKGEVLAASFDGLIKAVDLRGHFPEVKLVLAAGGKQIDCIFELPLKEAIGGSLDRRVRVTGKAIYDGKTGLPRRVVISEMKRVEGDDDFFKWKGAFDPFDVPAWGDEQ